MIKPITITLAAIMLSGCYAAYPVKLAADKVCEASDSKQDVLKEEFDKATHPHQIRVKCYTQVGK